VGEEVAEVAQADELGPDQVVRFVNDTSLDFSKGPEASNGPPVIALEALEALEAATDGRLPHLPHLPHGPGARLAVPVPAKDSIPSLHHCPFSAMYHTSGRDPKIQQPTLGVRRSDSPLFYTIPKFALHLSVRLIGSLDRLFEV